MATLLPFLYPARVLQRPLRGPVVRQFLRGVHRTAPRLVANGGGDDHDQPGNTAARRSPPKQRLSRDPIPFELPPDIKREYLPASEEDREQELSEEEGTITPGEREAFRRIFREIADRQKHASSGQDEREKLRQHQPTLDPTTMPERRNQIPINKIIRHASADQAHAKRVRQRARQASMEKKGMGGKPDVGRGVGAEGAGEMEGEEAAEVLTTTPEEVERLQAIAQFPASLRAAASAAMGTKGEKRQLIRELEQEEEDTAAEGGGPTSPQPSEDARRAAAAARRERQAKLEARMLAQKTDFGLWEFMERHVFSLVAEFGLAPNSVETKKKKKNTATLKKKAREALAMYGPLYPALLLHGLRLFDSHFALIRTSPLAFSVLPRVKSLGLASYVLGASTAVCNELLKIHWARRGDAAAVFALLAEMQRGGVAFDEQTRAVLASMEWHVLPLARDAGLVGNGDGHRQHTPLGTDLVLRNSADGGSNENHPPADPFLQAAVRHLPELRALPEQIAYWRAQVDRGIQLAQR